MVKFVELEADVFNGELEHVPEAGQVLGRGTRVGVDILEGGRRPPWKEGQRMKGSGDKSLKGMMKGKVENP